VEPTQLGPINGLVVRIPGYKSDPGSIPCATSSGPRTGSTQPHATCRLYILNTTQLSRESDRLCGLVVRVLGYRSRGPGSIRGTTKKKVVGLERGPLSLVSTTEELLDRKAAAPV
jgi:hypothetical protein